jgi:hypothetical protein
MKKIMLSLCVLTLIAFTSCEKADFPGKDEVKKWKKDDSKKDDTKKVCFDLVYPISYIMPDGSIATYNEEDAMNNGLKNWYTANSSTTAKPVLAYPVEVTFSDGTTKTIANEPAMIKLKKWCDGTKDQCFDIIYPISYTMPNGSLVTYADKDAFEISMKSWYNTNQDATIKPTLVYPIQVKVKDKTIKTIATKTEMIKLKKWCSTDKLKIKDGEGIE